LFQWRRSEARFAPSKRATQWAARVDLHQSWPDRLTIKGLFLIAGFQLPA
jgi:hypothetical protein